jgi:hypothetical protein
MLERRNLSSKAVAQKGWKYPFTLFIGIKTALNRGY